MASKKDVREVLKRRYNRAKQDDPKELESLREQRDALKKKYDEWKEDKTEGRYIHTELDGIPLKIRSTSVWFDSEEYHELNEKIKKAKRDYKAELRAEYEKIEEKIMLEGVDKKLLKLVDEFGTD